MNKQISLRIHSVKCVDETNGRFVEKLGNDEIKLSGFGIVETRTVTVNPFTVNSNFDDGEIQRFSPPRNFVTLNLSNVTSFPTTVNAGFLLAEIDNGDFGTKAGQIFTKLKEELEKKRKEEEAKKKKKSGNASLTGAELTVIWTIVKPIIFKFIVDKIAAAADDDIFPPQDTSVTLNSANHQFTAGANSTEFRIEFRGHGGIYVMTCDWLLS